MNFDQKYEQKNDQLNIQTNWIPCVACRRKIHTMMENIIDAILCYTKYYG